MLTDTGRNSAIAGITGTTRYFSLHTGVPDATGSNEVTGGSYARQPLTSGDWNAASGGQQTNSASLVFSVPAATTVFFVGMWTAVSGGTYLGTFGLGSALIGATTVAATGDLFTSNAHGLINTDRVVFTPFNAETLPGTVSAATVYFVISSTTNTFQISTTSGGAAVNVSSDAEAVFQKTVPVVFTLAGSLTYPAGQLVIASGL